MSNPKSPRCPSARASPEISERKVVRLEDENAWLRQQCARLEEQNARLVERIQTLEHRLGLHSRNSSEPPSSDGLKKLGSLRDKSERKPGGQPGHKGSTLHPVEHPDRVEDHVPAASDGCGSSLSDAPTATRRQTQAASDGCGSSLSDAAAAGTPSARQVFDLPEPSPLEVTGHRAHARCCGQCGTVTRAAFPDGVSAPAQYGRRLAGVAVTLQHAHFLPEDRLSQV